jgi:hypothetical protein
MFQIKFVEKISTHILCSINFSQKSCHMTDNVKKYGGTREATGEIMVAHCRLDN